jgi:hypothetical protein
METEETKMEAETSAIEAIKSEAGEKALSIMKELRGKYEEAGDDSKKKIDLNLYEFPKMIEAIKALPLGALEHTSEYKAMKKYGLNYYEEVRQQKHIEDSAQGYAETKE